MESPIQLYLCIVVGWLEASVPSVPNRWPGRRKLGLTSSCVPNHLSSVKCEKAVELVNKSFGSMHKTYSIFDGKGFPLSFHKS